MEKYFGREDCRTLKEGETFEKQFIVIKPSYMEHLIEEFRTPEYQLFYATSGFGCNPHSLGNAIFGADITERYRQERYNIIGIAKEETIKKWEETYGHKREEIIERAKGDHE